MKSLGLVLAAGGIGTLLGCGAAEPVSGAASPERLELVKLLGSSRPLPGRPIGTPPLPFSSRWRLPPDDREYVLRLLRELEYGAEWRSDSAALADAAFARLVARDPSRAVVLLERALAGRSDPSLLNDLAVARLEMHRTSGEARELVLALDAIERAARAGAQQPEVTFNRALILERLGLLHEAERAWRQAATDAQPGWASEARGNLRRVQQPTTTEEFDAQRSHLRSASEAGDLTSVDSGVGELIGHVRSYVQDELLAEWSDAASHGDAEGAAEIERLMTALSEELAARTGDPMLREAVAAIARTRGPARASLVQAHLSFARGKAAYDRLDVEGAVGPLEEAEAGLAAAASPFALWAAYLRAGCEFYRRDYDEVLRRIRPLIATAAAGNYHVVRGRSLIVEGVVSLEMGSPSAATAAFHRALDDFERTQELNYQAQVATLLANSARFVGEGEKAWSYRLRALTTAGRGGFAQRLAPSLGEAARAASLEGHYEAALAFLDEALAVLDDESEPVLVAEAYWWRAMVRHRAGQPAAAGDDIRRALRECTRIMNPQIRAQDESGIQVTAGAILRTTDPAAAVRHLTAALQRHHALGYRYLLVDTYLERGRAYRALDDDRAAQADFLAAIAEYERGRREIGSSRVRASYFDQARDLFDEAISLAVELDPSGESALDLSERGRAQTLFEALNAEGAASQPTEGLVAAARSTVPADTALVVYSVLSDETLAWVLVADGSSFVRLPFGARDLERRVDRLRSAILQGHHLESEDGHLFDALVRPLRDAIGRPRSVVIVPDRALHGLPFAALRDSRSGRPLTELWELSVTPSVRTYLQALRAEASLRDRSDVAVFAVTNPAIDRRAYPEVPDLAGAASEGPHLTQLFPRSLVLSGTAATPDRFLAELDDHDFVFFAGHAVVDAERPERSRLLLAPAGERPGDGDLFAGDIARQRLSRPRLVVLAGCDTAGGRWGSLEGSSSLAMPFLAAGVPVVLGSLWRVDDRATAAFMREFQDALAAHQDPGRALRTARGRMLSSSDSRLNRPAAWAAFQLIGATPPRRQEEEGS